VKVSYLTYGCKVNQYDTEIIKKILNNKGLKESDNSDIFIINTCTVTEKVDSEILKKIKQIKKDKNKKIILTGCLTNYEHNEIKNYVDFIIPNEKKFDINFYPSKILTFDGKNINVEEKYKKFSQKDKAFLKIEEGCNRFCSYCIVPYVRGDKIKIKDKNEVLDELKEFLDYGFKEIVLTGINLGLYGEENLLILLKGSLKFLKDARIRLSSIGPAELTDRIIDFVADNQDRICPHFHLSMQSGDDKILKLMNRNYTVSFYEKKCSYIIKKIPFAGITTDIISGFPGEGQEEYKNTYDLVKKLPLTRLHVFSYSDRKGTKAEKLKNKVSSEIKKQRVKELILLGKEKEREFIYKNSGQIRTVLIENKIKDGYAEGYTENYIRSVVRFDNIKTSNLIKVKIKDFNNFKAVAEIL